MHYKDGPRPRLFAHRGASGTAPENTLPAFAAALAAGADRLELDVHLTADEEVIVLHDEDVARTTDGAGPASKKRFSETRELDAGYGFQDPDGAYPFRGRGIRIPTLAEVLTSFPGVPLNIELKDDAESLVSAVQWVLHRHEGRERVLLTAEPGSLMEKIRRRIPGVLTGMCLPESLEFLCNGGNPGYVARGFALQVPTSLAGIPIVTPYFVEVAHACGLEVHAWVINEEAEMRALVAMGVDGIMTDFPELGARVLGRQPGD
ncbi:glycerophosphodiester phosphodiesterase [Polyangium jinanense]|uniref:Glycerophosphodiester phosphodiesterase n=1 Tax=Polyangium jinanense TaxID=2829994 RepID=A0A9X3X744_9BACT|nr:glycerophosphodiester phosphodiesterase [Polyangium jinanense]MDC3955912.1 glycerophosphodiester phosphodiesterase [Polyangium jinanense]MDC3983271.1 glycerophosphodiester phosphodiesterase [Polyangium jinanense]MDC3985149.1 glycerophosphodiester phosphodiesterase [Polyangium jinanense]